MRKLQLSKWTKVHREPKDLAKFIKDLEEIYEEIYKDIYKLKYLPSFPQEAFDQLDLNAPYQSDRGFVSIISFDGWYVVGLLENQGEISTIICEAFELTKVHES